MKKQKGITLIALIITIIVMLILVAVTINVALNGGLFTKADDSALKTEKQSVYEQTVAAMVLDNNGDLDVNATGTEAMNHFKANLDSNATWDYTSGTNSGTLTVHGKRGTYEIKISAVGIGQPEVVIQTVNPDSTGDDIEGEAFSNYGKIYAWYDDDYKEYQFTCVFVENGETKCAYGNGEWTGDINPFDPQNINEDLSTDLFKKMSYEEWPASIDSITDKKTELENNGNSEEDWEGCSDLFINVAEDGDMYAIFLSEDLATAYPGEDQQLLELTDTQHQILLNILCNEKSDK